MCRWDRLGTEKPESCRGGFGLHAENLEGALRAPSPAERVAKIGNGVLQKPLDVKQLLLAVKGAVGTGANLGAEV